MSVLLDFNPSISAIQSDKEKCMTRFSIYCYEILYVCNGLLFFRRCFFKGKLPSQQKTFQLVVLLLFSLSFCLCLFCWIGHSQVLLVVRIIETTVSLSSIIVVSTTLSLALIQLEEIWFISCFVRN